MKMADIVLNIVESAGTDRFVVNDLACGTIVNRIACVSDSKTEIDIFVAIAEGFIKTTKGMDFIAGRDIDHATIKDASEFSKTARRTIRAPS